MNDTRRLARDIESHTRSIRTLRADMEIIAHDVVTQRDIERQAKEDTRANHRNFNRLLTLLTAWALTFFITWGFQTHSFVSWGWLTSTQAKTLAPYSFFVIITLDSALALYGMIKRY